MFTIEGFSDWNELEDQIRHVPLLQQREGVAVYPYLEADISLKEIDYDQVRPTSLYVVSSNLELQKQLSADLSPEYDPLNLPGRLLIKAADGNITGLIPPIVEETKNEGLYILDGTHRTYLGRQAGRLAFTAIHIANFKKDCPAAVLPNDWNEIQTYDHVPADPALKRHYRPNQLTLRRDFSSLNGSKPRNS